MNDEMFPLNILKSPDFRRAQKLFDKMPYTMQSVYHHPAWLLTWAKTFDFLPCVLARHKATKEKEWYPTIYYPVFMRPYRTETAVWLDAISNYSYGGALYNQAEYTSIAMFLNWKNKWLNKQGIVSEFVRYDPYLMNHIPDEHSIQSGNVFYIDLSADTKTIMSHMKKSARNAILNASRQNLTVEHGHSPEHIKIFQKIYNSAMDAKKAKPFYRYPDKFYAYLNDYMVKVEALEVFIIRDEDGLPIAASLELHGYGKVHDFARVYLNDQPQKNAHNLLLWEVVKWAKEGKNDILDLGGQDQSGSMSFKENFAGDWVKPRYIAKNIINNEQYEKLVHQANIGETSEQPYFPAYRSTDIVRVG